jgi:WD40 repeat protein
VAHKPEPYVGPRPFSRLEVAKFFGREDEASELLSLIIAHPVVLLYSESGAGKTSLLNAMVVPMLEGRNSQVFDPARVGGALPQWIKYTDVKNIYTFNAILSMRGELLNSQSVWGMSFADFMKTQEVATQDRQYSRRVVVFDQFEEIFSTHPERWKDREVFFNSVSDALEQDSSLRVVFVIREEYIAHMDSLAPLLPERLRTRFRLERLREESALLAVTMPLKGTGYSFAPGAAEKLVRDLLRVPIKSAAGTVEILGEFAEPVQLQVVCKRMWQSLPPSVKEIDESFIENYGNANDALASYYDASIEKAAKKSNVKEGVLRRWFGQKLITPDRTRGTVYKDAYVESGLTSGAIAILEDLHLIRTEIRGGAPWYELTHDRFITPIIESNEAWFDRMQGGKSIGQRLEERAQTWAYSSIIRQTNYLLKEGELEEAKRWVEGANAEGYVVSETLLQFIQASQVHVEKRLRQQRNVSLVLTATAIALALAVIILSILLATQGIKVERIEKSRANGQIAEYLSDIPPNEFTSIQWGLLAFEGLGTDPPQEAVDGLRAAITAFGNSTWLRGMPMPTRITEAKLSSNSDYAVAYSQTEVCVWKTDTGTLLFKTTKKENEDEYISAELTPDGKRLITMISLKFSEVRNDEASQANEQREKKREFKTEIWDVSNRKGMALWSHTATKKSLTLNDYRHILVLDSTKSFVINAETVDGPTPSDKYDVNLTAQEAENVKAAVILPKELHLIVAGGQGNLRAWDLNTGKVIKNLLPADNVYFAFKALHFSAEENRLVFIGEYWESSRYIYKIYIVVPDGYQLGRPITFVPGDDFSYSCISADGKSLIVLTEGDDAYLRVSSWDVTSGKTKLTNRESTINTNVRYWHNEVGMFKYDIGKKQLVFEDYDTGETSTLLSYIPKHGDINLADVSPKGLVLASTGNTHIYIRERGSEMLNVEKYSPEQLKSKGCELLRDQPEFDPVKTICN